MRKNKIRKITALMGALALMTSSVPLYAVQTMASSNIVSNSTFDSNTSGWGTYKESGGACSLSTENGRLALKVSNVGRVNYAVQVFYDIVPLYQNGVYRLKYDISCTTDRFIECMIQQNGGTYQAYTWKGLELTSTPQSVDYEFTMEAETDIMSKLVFNCGIQEEHEGVLPEHTIYIDNVSLELVDDSKVDYSASRPYEPDINVNQVGYRPESSKTAVFKNADNAESFSVVNADTNQVVYTGKLSDSKNYSSADQNTKKGDFSAVKDSGKYYISCEGLDNSYTFEIGDNVYKNLIDDSVRMLYLQRCGCQVDDAVFGHGACHNTMAKVYGTDQTIDVSGGWHDAGDYGRYIVPAAKAVADLLYAYQENPDSSFLEEAKYEIEWMKKMQSDNGGVYHKVTCENFPAYVAPEKETAELIVTPVSTTSTADFCGAMALAYEFYKDSDSSFAQDCLERAERAWAFLEANPNLIFENPEDISTGEYGDTSDKDERYWASAQLYRATKNQKYLSYIENNSISTGLDWSTVGDYGNIALITMKDIDRDSSIYTKALASVISQADKLVSLSNSNDYGAAVSKFNWGSNMTIANAGIILGLAYKSTGESKYLDSANVQLDYLLGKNPLGTCFVTGYGTVSPQNPHHRPSMAVNQAMKGMLVGGVNQNLEDSAAKAYCQDLPSAKRYVDNSESYSTNEITIYWNSPLTYLLTLTEKKSDEPAVTTVSSETTTVTTETTTVTTETTAVTTETTAVQGQTTQTSSDVLWGDANCDGKVTLADCVAVLQHISNSQKYGLSAQGLTNADVNNNGDGVTGKDALSIQKYDSQLISSLPESYMNGQSAGDNTSGLKDYGTPMNENASAVADFRKGETPLFFASDGWSNGSFFDCV